MLLDIAAFCLFIYLIFIKQENDGASLEQLQNSSGSLDHAGEFSDRFQQWVASGDTLCF
jgi:hypothetical protein